MPREIADSDAESDLVSPRRPIPSPIPEHHVDFPLLSTLEQDPFANLEFDQFLSPTQRLSSALERLDAEPSHSMSSNDKFLQEIAQADHSMLNSTANTQGLDGSFEEVATSRPRNKAKRTLSDIEGGNSRSTQDDDMRRKSSKRSRTYGSSNTQRVEENSFLLNTADIDEYRNKTTHDGRMYDHSETTSTELPIQQLVDPERTVERGTSSEPRIVDYAQNYQRHGATNFLQSKIQNTSMTNSFTGGYKGINMDFRGAGLSLDVSANPFGSLSQISLDGDIDPSQTEKFASLFHHSQEASGDTPAMDFVDPITAPHLSHLNEMATSPAEATKNTQQHTMTGGSDNSKQDEPAKKPPKKRGRKPKVSDVSVEMQQPGAEVLEQLPSEDPLDLPPEQYKPRPSRSRAGTVDSLDSHVSHESRATDASTRKRKRSVLLEATVSAKDKHPSSELNLSDPAMIGAPKDMYVPRPSKSRSRRTVEEGSEDELQAEKQPLSNAASTVAAVKPSSDETTEAVQATNTKKKPGRKSKVKRAKTSAAALLKSAEMYDEDDKDCIIVDEVPAKVKIGPLAEISPVKHESKADLGEKSHKVHELDRSIDGPAASNREASPQIKKISIDIPAPPKPAQDREPKKRGRKPKKKPEVQISAGPNDEVVVDKPQQDDDPPPSISNETQPVLSEKDPNIRSPTKSPITPTEEKTEQQLSISPQKPVHSPLKPSSRSSTSTPVPNPASASGSVKWVKPRIGLSRRLTIPSLLRKLDRSKEPPRVVEHKTKLSKKQQEEEDKRKLQAEDAGEDYNGRDRWEVRGKDGLLVEWDD